MAALLDEMARMVGREMISITKPVPKVTGVGDGKNVSRGRSDPTMKKNRPPKKTRDAGKRAATRTRAERPNFTDHVGQQLDVSPPSEALLDLIPVAASLKEHRITQMDGGRNSSSDDGKDVHPGSDGVMQDKIEDYLAELQRMVEDEERKHQRYLEKKREVLERMELQLKGSEGARERLKVEIGSWKLSTNVLRAGRKKCAHGGCDSWSTFVLLW